jgi:hypothetical protein
MKKAIFLLSSFVLLISLITISNVFALTPTSKWKDFYGIAVGGKVGNIITAKDPQGVICGQFTIKRAGNYGFLHVYADDLSTSVDEGAKAGDNITFYSKNKSVGSGIWDSSKDIINLDLFIANCNETWKCTAWKKCINWTQTRTCTDSNKCGTTNLKPAETQNCNCTESWKCSAWSKCVNSIATRSCTDNNICGTVKSKPAETTKCNALFWNLIH